MTTSYFLELKLRQGNTSFLKERAFYHHEYILMDKLSHEGKLYTAATVLRKTGGKNFFILVYTFALKKATPRKNDIWLTKVERFLLVHVKTSEIINMATLSFCYSGITGYSCFVT